MSRHANPEIAKARHQLAQSRTADKWALVKMAARITELETALKLHDAIAEADRKCGDDAMWTVQYAEACEATTAALGVG